MIGVVVFFKESSGSVHAIGPERDLLGAPIAARAIASACPPGIETRIVVAAPSTSVAKLRDEIIPRFGLIEVREVIAEQDLMAALRRGYELFGEQAELIVLHDARRPLLTHDLLLRVIEAARSDGAAAAALPLDAAYATEDAEGRIEIGSQAGFVLQCPQAAQPSLLRNALDHAAENIVDMVDLLARTSVRPKLVTGDQDNLYVGNDADVGRAIEVWSRRAVDFPFLWPRPDRLEDLMAQRAEDAEARVGDNDGQDTDSSDSLDQALANYADAEQDAADDNSFGVDNE